MGEAVVTGDTALGPLLVLGGGGAGLLGAEPDVPALLRHAALHPAADLDGAQLYDASYRRWAPVRDGTGAVVALRPVERADGPDTARRERVRAQLTRTMAALRRALALQLLHQQAAAALTTAGQVAGGGDPRAVAAATAAGELAEASRALLAAAGMRPAAPAAVEGLSALLVDLDPPDPHGGLDRAVTRLVHRFGSGGPGGAPVGPPVEENTGSPGHNLLHSLFGRFHRERPR